MVRIPLKQTKLPGVVEPGLKALAELLMQTGRDEFALLPFLVDSGANISIIPVTTAQDLGLRLPSPHHIVEVQTATGKVRQQVRPGRFKVRIPGLDNEVFDWPCHFVEHDGSPPPLVLGLAGILNDIRLTFDGTYSLDARYGFLQIERYAADTPA